MKKKRKVIVGIAIVIVILIIAVIVILNKTNMVERILASINGSDIESEEELIAEKNKSVSLLDASKEDEEKNSIDLSNITDGYYDEENKVTWHVEEDGLMCPVPDGYVGSEATGEDEINTGYVIYEGTEEVTDDNVATAKTSRNQYVWIPVDEPSELYGTDSDGKKWGKLYDFSETDGITALNWSESNGVMSITDNTQNRESDIVEDYDTDEFLVQLEQEFNAMIESVEKYGGFYIGRYETGNISQNTAVVVQGNTDIEDTTWYNSYEKSKTLSEDNENVETGLIWGCQWDRTLIWLIESGNKSIEEICSDSSGWGNYRNSTFQYTNSSGETETSSIAIIPTGSTEYTNANNIYDLAGNVWEWTIEAYGSYFRCLRGGYFINSGASSPASNRFSTYPSISVSYFGFRAYLYIQ